MNHGLGWTTGLRVLLMGACLQIQGLSAAVIDVSMDTTALKGTTGSLVFDFTSLDGVQENNTIGIGLFTTDSDTLLGGSSSLGAVSGALPGNVVLRDRFYSPWDFTELAQTITFGDSLFFRLTVSEKRGPGPGPDSLSIFLLSSDLSASLVTSTDATMAIMAVDIVDAADGVQVEIFDPITVAGSQQSLPMNARIRIIQRIPEPPSVLLVLLGVALVGRAGRRYSPR